MPNYILKVLDFYRKISTQWIVGFSGRVGLNYQSVESVANIYNFELTPFNMTVIQEVESFILKRERDKNG